MTHYHHNVKVPPLARCEEECQRFAPVIVSPLICPSMRDP